MGVQCTYPVLSVDGCICMQISWYMFPVGAVKQANSQHQIHDQCKCRYSTPRKLQILENIDPII